MFIEKKHGYCIVYFKNDFLSKNPYMLKKLLLDEIDHRIKNIILNLVNIRFIGSSGLVFLKQIKDIVRPMGVDVCLMNVQEEVKKILMLTNFHVFFTVIDSESVVSGKIYEDDIRNALNPYGD